MDEKKISDELIEISEEICDRYCKYRNNESLESDEAYNEFLKEYCDKCPINRLYSERMVKMEPKYYNKADVKAAIFDMIDKNMSEWMMDSINYDKAIFWIEGAMSATNEILKKLEGTKE